MHDVTEGGVLGAIYELAVASDKGAMVDDELIPIGNTASAIAALFGLDPRYCVGAGSMIIACDSGKAKDVIKRLSEKDILCQEVGKITEKEAGIQIQKSGVTSPLTYLETDPYWSAYFNAIKDGWK